MALGNLAHGAPIPKGLRHDRLPFAIRPTLRRSAGGLVVAAHLTRHRDVPSNRLHLAKPPRLLNAPDPNFALPQLRTKPNLAIT
jgi:hypothetical protein